MLTPQEVASRAFSKATFNGYNMGQVDEFLDTLTADYTALYKENAVLKSKMKVLVDKIEEYRSTEDAMRSALLTAQKMANSMVAEAEEKKQQLLREAENAANARILELRRQIATEELRLAAAKNSTAEFTTQMKEMLAREIQFLNDLPQVEAQMEETAAPLDEMDQTVQDIEHSVQAILDQQEEEALDEEDTKDIGDVLQRIQEVVEQDEEESGSVTQRLDLQFGRNYHIE